MKNGLRIGVGALALLGAAAGRISAQGAPTPAPVKLTVGSMAPDFALPGATRYGRLGSPVRLSDYRGQTVVIAFFYKARTKG